MKGFRTLKSLANICVVGTLVVLASCGDGPTVAPARPIAAKGKAEKGISKQQDEKVAKDEIFVYSSIGQRDPFESLLQKEKNAREAKGPKTPLEKFDLGQFRIQAILIGKGAPRAMVSAPDGKNYILNPGLKIGKNNGVIKEITQNAVVVEESSFDLAGNLIKGLQSITVSNNDKN